MTDATRNPQLMFYIHKTFRTCRSHPISQKSTAHTYPSLFPWRSIALATKDLWTCLRIYLRRGMLSKDPAIVHELATQWFSRAGAHATLSLQFDGPFNSGRHGYDFSSIILSRSEQFRELKIHLPNRDAYALELATFLRGEGNASYAFPQLEDLSMDSCHPANNIEITFAAAGRLRRINANIRFISWDAKKNFAPWKQLTCLETGCMKVTIWVPMFAQCINLETGTFYIMYHADFDDPLPAVNVTMARLTSLSVGCPFRSSSVKLFDGFRFPALTSLHFELGQNFLWRHPEHFYDQLRSLHTLTFVGTSEDLVTLLHHTPSSLVHLGAMTETNPDPLLIGLTATNESNPLAPQLRQLTIKANIWTGRSSTDGLLLTMVASRTKNLEASACTLEYLAITLPATHLDNNGILERQLLALQMSRVESRRPCFHWVGEDGEIHLAESWQLD